ncbi:acyl-CoA dehydrogenase family protein [Belnapia rosea]|uniref:(2S)-methylsuccinyl-CoA dehydrogenase n=1 Tax=Belnapia rosea TaxID=938405 RepID=A0A1G6SR67_9PROT|nr:acyl-CoA dehydrogenase family protein [Belnapia rosea]SDB60889.1 (2S)-methylsuccinyl-CoA dehydrogenase [Belnapia rosea]SDD19372.1 (2S)-methylsuccinyl-CoA dehydrogenase [Belnapia rosea]
MQGNPPTQALLDRCATALDSLEGLQSAAKAALAARLLRNGRADGAALEREQLAAHGYAWLATYATALGALLARARRLEAGGVLSPLERLVLEAGFSEYLAQVAGGIAMSQNEIVRLEELGLPEADLARFLEAPAVQALRRVSQSGLRAEIAAAIGRGDEPHEALGDDMLDMIRDQFRRFAAEAVAPEAARIHREDALIPMSLLASMAELGVFGITIPEERGGQGLGKVAMCVVTEELSRASLAVGSLATRSEIAAELIAQNGTEAQKAAFLPGIASGAIIPTAVFTEPNTGSDLASVRTRAVPEDGVYRVTGGKTWITHAARADLMTVLVRTGAPEEGHRGLSILLAGKPRGTEEDPFPAAGMTGAEIKVLGYRGMKEYEIAFDGFMVPEDRLLGGVTGQGFRQLMATFEAARIQTAARAVGVAWNAYDLALRYARERTQFGKPLFAFPRVHGKLAMMLVENVIARELTLAAARRKDQGGRCDIEAGMAKLLAARIAWSNADAAVQIHGGNGYAEEYAVSRVLVDARILNIFEGAAEIQAGVIARGLLEGRN